MAILISPLPERQKVKGYKKTIRLINSKSGQSLRFNDGRSKLDPSQLLALRLKLDAANLAWRSIKTWKKMRWSLCAMATFHLPAAPSNAPNYSGYTLFIKSWLEQDTPAGKLPISPCSARATDPNANPWDYTP